MCTPALSRAFTLHSLGALIAAAFLVALTPACSSHSPAQRAAATGSSHRATAPSSGSASPAPGATTQPAAPGAPPPPGIPRCHTSEVAVTFTGVHLGVALWLTNRSSRTCSVYGYEGLGFLDSRGELLPTLLSRVAETHSRVLLRPGVSAHATLVWRVMPDRKRPFVSPGQVEITPPTSTPTSRCRGRSVAWWAATSAPHR